MPGTEIYDIGLGKNNRAFGFNMDPAGVLPAQALYVWDPVGLAWVPMTQPGSSGGSSAPIGTVAVSGIASTVAVAGTFWQVTQPVSGTVSLQGTAVVSGTVAVSNMATSVSVSGSVAIASFPATTALVSGSVSVSNTVQAQLVSSTTQPVTGTVVVSSLSTTAVVSGSVGIASFPASTALVSGSVAIASFPSSTANVSGSITTISATGTINVTGAITTISATGTVNTGITTITGTGTLNVGISTISPAGTAKGTQAGLFLPVQDAKDSGRALRVFTINYTTAPGTEALATFTVNQGLNVTTSVSLYTVTSGKTLRLQAISGAALNATTTQSNAKLRVRTSSATSIGSPVCIDLAFPAVAGTTVASLGVANSLAIPDGLEIAGGQSIGISTVSTPTSTALVGCSLIGYEY